MSNEQLNDLKQFVAVTVSQSEKRLEFKISSLHSRIDTLQADLNQLRCDMNDGFAGVGEAIEGVYEYIHEYVGGPGRSPARHRICGTAKRVSSK